MVELDLDEYVRANSILYEERLSRSISALDGKRMLSRRAFIEIGEEVKRFVKGDSQMRLFVLPGLRGVGKTTILNQLHAQLISEMNVPPSRILHVSMDEATGILGAGMKELANSYERLIGKALHSLSSEEKVFLLVDEAQYDRNWGVVAKVIFDNSLNVLQLVTGSSALDLQINPDVARRASFREIWPMDLIDYRLLRGGPGELSNLGNELSHRLLTAADLSDAQGSIARMPKEGINRLEPDEFELSRFLRVGGYPASTSGDNEPYIIDGIYRSLEKVIMFDLGRSENYETDTLAKVMGLVGLVAASGRISYEKLGASVGLSKPTVMRILEDLRKAGALIRIDSLGSDFVKTRKTPSFRPATPGLRLAILWKAGAWRGSEAQYGLLLEDAIAAILHHARQQGAIANFYVDDREAMADFIVQRVDASRVVVEASWGKKDHRQAVSSMRTHSAAYAVNCAKNAIIACDEAEGIIDVPRAALLHDATLSRHF
jgi:predicted AAA+ superfamily ATPase